MFAEFIRFYNYTAEQALAEYGKRFFSLVNSMYRIKAKEDLREIVNVAAGMSGNKEIVTQLQKQEGGNQAILEQVKVAKEVNNVN